MSDEKPRYRQFKGVWVQVGVPAQYTPRVRRDNVGLVARVRGPCKVCGYTFVRSSSKGCPVCQRYKEQLAKEERVKLKLSYGERMRQGSRRANLTRKKRESTLGAPSK